MRIPILARTDRWAIVAKPSGLPVHRSRMVNERDTLLRAVRRELDGFVAPVHRLDRAASGCLLLALDRSYAAQLQQALVEGEKRYLAFVRGQVRSFDEVRVDNPMKDDNGLLKEATTFLKPVATTEEPRSSLVLARPVTGRYHQVRRHCRDLSHPVLCDAMHGDSRVNRWWREHHGLKRLGLHCLSMDLVTPEGEHIRATCPVPDDLKDIWRRLPWWDQALAAVPELHLEATVPACAP
jgi:tRNA pseudouridine65 synthase